MRLSISLLLLLFLAVSVFGQYTDEKPKPTHQLELTVPHSEEPEQIKATLFTKSVEHFITLHYEDGNVTTEYLVPDNNKFKFQLNDIDEDQLIVVQFIGAGDVSDEISGNYIAFVDGEKRQDMSGTFTLKKM